MGAILMGLACIPFGIVKPEIFLNLTPQVLYPLAYAVFISSALCYALINYATSLTSATIVTAFWPFQVPVATIESYIVFGEAPGWQDYVGALFIIAGLIAVCTVKYYQEKEENNLKRVRVTTADEFRMDTKVRSKEVLLTK